MRQRGLMGTDASPETTPAREASGRLPVQAWLDMIRRLAAAADWPVDEAPIELVQTHISAVLIGRHHVLKLKKPVNFGFLDYTTLEMRRRACEAEVILNSRLCPDVYLGVKSIAGSDEQPRLNGDGPIIDYGVWMKRLPSEMMLDQLVARDEVTESVIDRVAARVADFHRQARHGPDIDMYGGAATIRTNWEENFTQTLPFVGRTITGHEFDGIKDRVDNWMTTSADLLYRRVRDGYIRDGHGDMRSESICVSNGISIFDCIEFNDRFRYGDVASEVAFLAMDLDARGRPDLGYYLAERYEQETGDTDLFKLLPFYRCYRAYVRGKVLSFRLDEPEFSEGERASATSRAKSYFHLARRYSARLASPAVIVIAGLSGTGKTSLARAIAGELGLRVVSSDAIRKSIFGPGEHKHAYGEGPYSAEGNRLTYEKMVETGRGLLREEHGVVLDATFRRASDRAVAIEMANQSGANFRMIECKLPPEMVRPRLERRAARGETLSEADWDTYLRQRDEMEPADDLATQQRLSLSNTHAISITGHLATDWLRENDAAP